MKPWAPLLQQHIAGWSAKLGTRDWWPKYVYHYTDVRNAAEIVRIGALFSRADTIRLGLMHVENASPTVIDHTASSVQRYVRLYFRPLTPTQFRNEGIRPIAHQELGAHCPVPVFFCFDATKVLARDDSLFSNGNMAAAGVQYGGSLEHFQQIPFKFVFHFGPYDPSQSPEIKFHRNAEVLVPTTLPLADNLVFIACRSIAERETLINLLPIDMQDVWGPRIRVGLVGLTERRWSFVEQVRVLGVDQFQVLMNPSTLGPGPFDVKMHYVDNLTKTIYRLETPVADVRRLPKFTIKDASSGVLTIQLDTALAYKGRLVFTPIPF